MFWYGSAALDWLSTPVGLLQACCEHLPGLIAEQKMALAEVAAYGQADEKGRNRLWGHWSRTAGHGQEAITLTPKEQQARLALVGIGVKIVTAEESKTV
jgi:hypothetical protein